MKVKTIATALLAIGLAGPLQASVLFNGGAPDYQSGLLATSWTGEPGGAAATKFSVAGGISFNSISWSGAYNYFGATEQAHGVRDSYNAFTFNLYSANGALPGTLLKTITLGTGNGTVDPASPEADPSGQFTRMYSYSANFALESLADGTYFASLSNAYAFGELSPPFEEENAVDFDWFWGSTSESQLGAAFFDDGSWTTGDDDGVFGLAFQLLGDPVTTGTNNVPEPGSLALVALALAGLSAARQRPGLRPQRVLAI